MNKTLSLKIHAIPALKDNYIWTLINTETSEVIIVDPGESMPAIHFLSQNNLSLTAILVTHHHWDHTNGIGELKDKYDVKVYGAKIENIPTVTHALNDQEIFKIENFPEFLAISIPGHTLGHMAYYGNGLLFSGDTLFSAGCGRLFEGTAEQLYTSLQKLSALPDETKIYCGHEYTQKNLQFAHLVEPNNADILNRLNEVNRLRQANLPSLPSSLYQEKLTNPFLRCDSDELITNVEKFSNQKLVNTVDVFTCLRKWKDSY